MILTSIIVFAVTVPVSLIFIPLLTGTPFLSGLNFGFSFVIATVAALVDPYDNVCLSRYEG